MDVAQTELVTELRLCAVEGRAFPFSVFKRAADAIESLDIKRAAASLLLDEWVIKHGNLRREKEDLEADLRAVAGIVEGSINVHRNYAIAQGTAHAQACGVCTAIAKLPPELLERLSAMEEA